MSFHVREYYGSVCLALCSNSKAFWRQPVILFIFSSAFAGMLEDKVYAFLAKACGLRERDSELVSLNIVANRLLVKVNSLWSVLQMIFF